MELSQDKRSNRNRRLTLVALALILVLVNVGIVLAVSYINDCPDPTCSTYAETSHASDFMSAVGPFTAPASATTVTVDLFTDNAINITTGIYTAKTGCGSDCTGTGCVDNVDENAYPDTLLANSAGGVPSGSGAQWRTQSVTASITSGTKYFIGINGAGAWDYFFLNVTGESCFKFKSLAYSAGSLPGTFPAGATGSGRKVAIRIAYNVAAPATGNGSLPMMVNPGK